MKNLSEMNLAMASDHAGFALKQKVKYGAECNRNILKYRLKCDDNKS